MMKRRNIRGDLTRSNYILLFLLITTNVSLVLVETPAIIILSAIQLKPFRVKKLKDISHEVFLLNIYLMPAFNCRQCQRHIEIHMAFSYIFEGMDNSYLAGWLCLGSRIQVF